MPFPLNLATKRVYATQPPAWSDNNDVNGQPDNKHSSAPIDTTNTTILAAFNAATASAKLVPTSTKPADTALVAAKFIGSVPNNGIVAMVADALATSTTGTASAATASAAATTAAALTTPPRKTKNRGVPHHDEQRKKIRAIDAKSQKLAEKLVSHSTILGFERASLQDNAQMKQQQKDAAFAVLRRRLMLGGESEKTMSRKTRKILALQSAQPTARDPNFVPEVFKLKF